MPVRGTFRRPKAPSARPIFLGRTTTALLLVEHQVGRFSGMRDIHTADLKANLVADPQAGAVYGALNMDFANLVWQPKNVK